jgi:RNA polymerase sigma factor (sigma-70 family)
MRPSREAIDEGGLPAGRNAALTALFAAHYRGLVGLARLLVNDRAGAEDVVQDAFLALSRRWGRLRDPAAAHAYLQRSVVNGARSRLRRSYVRQRLHLVPSPDEPSAESAALDRAQVSQMRVLIGALSGRQREVLVLRYYLDLSEAEIAELLGISTGSVARLRAAFREEADLAMAQADVGSAFVEFGARLRKDRHRRAVRAIAACLALLAGITAAIGVTHEVDDRRPVITPPTPDPGGPRLNDPSALPIEPGQEFTGQGRRYFSPGFGPEFSFVESPSRWSVGGPVSAHVGANAISQPHRGALYLVRGDGTRSTQLLTFLIWRNVLDDNFQPSPVPPDIAAWLAANPHLADIRQQSDTVAGLAAVRVDAKLTSFPFHDPPSEYCHPPVQKCLLLADNADQTNPVTDGRYEGRPGPKPAYVELGARVRFWIIPLPNGEQFVIQASAQPADFDPFIADVDRILKSLVIAR